MVPSRNKLMNERTSESTANRPKQQSKQQITQPCEWGDTGGTWKPGGLLSLTRGPDCENHGHVEYTTIYIPTHIQTARPSPTHHSLSAGTGTGAHDDRIDGIQQAAGRIGAGPGGGNPRQAPFDECLVHSAGRLLSHVTPWALLLHQHHTPTRQDGGGTNRYRRRTGTGRPGRRRGPRGRRCRTQRPRPGARPAVPAAARRARAAPVAGACGRVCLLILAN